VNGTRADNPLRGRIVIAPAFVTPGSDDSCWARARWNTTIASRVLNRLAGSVRRAASTPVESNPGATACTFAKLFASIVMTMSRTTASATSELTSTLRMPWLPAVVERLSSCSASRTSTPAEVKAGMTPNSTPVTEDTISEKARTATSTRISLDRGNCVGAIAINATTPTA
jgi:hypothetical protein